MENLNIEKFSQKKADLILLVENIKKTVISVPGDKTGYALMKENKRILQKQRTVLVEEFENERAGARAYANKIMELQKEFIGIIEPTENELTEKIKAIDEETEKLKRIKLIPERQEKLKEINLIVDDEFLTLMDENKFNGWFNEQKEIYLFNEQEKIRKQQEEIEEQKRKIEDEKRMEEVRKQAEKEAQEKAIRDAELAKLKAEEEKQKAIEFERKKAEEEKARIIADQEAKEKARIEAENQAKQAEQERLRLEKEAQEKLEKKKKYQKFLADNGYTDKNKNEFLVKNDDGKISLFKLVGIFNN